MKLHKKYADKVAIVGMAPQTRDQAPFKDESWEIWGMNEIYLYVPRLTVLFEIHDRMHYQSAFRNPDHVKWLKKTKVPIYMAKQYDDFPTCIPYPWEEMIAEYGYNFSSAISEMLALALSMEYKKIGIWGVELNRQEEFYQRYCVGFFIGMVEMSYRLKGWPELYIPLLSNLSRYPFVYGRDGTDDIFTTWRNLSVENKKYVSEYEKKMLQYRDELYKAKGKLELLEDMKRSLGDKR